MWVLIAAPKGETKAQAPDSLSNRTFGHRIRNPPAKIFAPFTLIIAF
jgi:hypothetical protein